MYMSFLPVLMTSKSQKLLDSTHEWSQRGGEGICTSQPQKWKCCPCLCSLARSSLRWNERKSRHMRNCRGQVNKIIGVTWPFPWKPQPLISACQWKGRIPELITSSPCQGLTLIYDKFVLPAVKLQIKAVYNFRLSFKELVLLARLNTYYTFTYSTSRYETATSEILSSFEPLILLYNSIIVRNITPGLDWSPNIVKVFPAPVAP